MKSQSIDVAFPACLTVFLVLTMMPFSYSREPKLKEVFKDRFLIGVALNENQIFEKDTKALKILQEHFNSITPENVMKWEPIHPKPDQYHFGPADQFVALGEKNHMFIVGHTLVWHAQTPAWVFQDESGNPVDRETLLSRMREHIFTVVGRYKGRVHGWDVVNEAIDDDGQLRKSKWLKIIGEDYIEKAFEYAHEADPDAELYYNDYSLYHPAKREGVIRLIQSLQSKGIRVDGIGEQGHWGMDYPEKLEDLEQSIIAFSELGVKVMITELDVSVLPFPDEKKGADVGLKFEFKKEMNPYPKALPDSMQKKLADRYSEFFKIFLKHKDKISRVTIWGIQDGQSWLNDWPIPGRTNYPLLFDRQYQPKPAFKAVVKTGKKYGK